ncbi:hypothetical protein RHGRI_031517 [Rhododendron griersonianum]|uniref:Ubiquitin-like domain-containing protein n=1 Tax=Rhododendron griersonianum TaxID=479676 RepID=A0AAV6I8M3_9ERIC|nr:hypothetical protein RHGRI_031517 [Rhododendron griersonianum]
MIDIYLRVRLEVPLRKLKLAYCDRVGLDCDEIRFTFDGTRIGDQQTAGDMEMEDGDVIDAWSDQWGETSASRIGPSLFSQFLPKSYELELKQLKQQQHGTMIWGQPEVAHQVFQNRGRNGGGRPVDLSPVAWPTLQQSQQQQLSVEGFVS